MANLWLLALGPAGPGDALSQAGVAPSLLGHPCQTLRSYLPCPCSFHVDPEMSLRVPLQTDPSGLPVGSGPQSHILTTRCQLSFGIWILERCYAACTVYYVIRPARPEAALRNQTMMNIYNEV